MRNKKQEILKSLKNRGVVSSQKNDPAIAKSIKSKRVHSTKSKRVHSIESERVPWFFPDGDMEAGWTYAFGLAHWTIDEFAAFSLGKSPEKVSWEQVKRLIKIEEQAREYARRLELARRAVKEGVLSDQTPQAFIQWAVGIHLDLPDELLKQLGERSPDPDGFTDLESLSWDEITITLLSGDHLEVLARGITRKVFLADLGLMNKTNNRPTKSYLLLTALAATDRGQVKSERAHKDHMNKLRKSLKEYFGINTDPLPVEGGNYVPRFLLVDKRDAADQRAKKRALRTTIPFDDGNLAHQGADRKTSHVDPAEYPYESDELGEDAAAEYLKGEAID